MTASIYKQDGGESAATAVSVSLITQPKNAAAAPPPIKSLSY